MCPDWSWCVSSQVSGLCSTVGTFWTLRLWWIQRRTSSAQRWDAPKNRDRRGSISRFSMNTRDRIQVSGTDSDYVFETVPHHPSWMWIFIMCWPPVRWSVELICSALCGRQLTDVFPACVQVRRLVCDSSRHKLLVLAGQCVEDTADIVLQKGCFSLNHFIHIFADEEVRKRVTVMVSEAQVCSSYRVYKYVTGAVHTHWNTHIMLHITTWTWFD